MALSKKEEHLIIDVSISGVATLTINRPDTHNAFDDQLIHHLHETLVTLQKDKNLRFVMLKAAGKNFSAGADLRWMKRMADYSEQENLDDALHFAKLMHALWSFPKPTVVLVQGNTFGGGIGLIACCDIAIAAEDASFCFSEVKIGLIPAVISPFVLARIGQRAARRYFLTAERFDANTALNLGLLHAVVPATELEAAGERMLHILKQNSPAAMSATKKLLEGIQYQAISEEVLKTVAAHIAAIRVSKEGQAGIDAFLKKQSPPWLHSTRA